MTPQPRDCAQQLWLVGRVMKSLNTDVITQVERRCIDPQRTAETSPGHVEHLTKPGQEMQSTLDSLLRGLNSEAAISVEKAAAVEDTQSADVLRPHLIRPED
jgi:hypothetical protein